MQANDFSQLLEQLASSERDGHRYRSDGSVVELSYGESIADINAVSASRLRRHNIQYREIRHFS